MKNKVIIGIMLTLLCIGMLTCIFNVLVLTASSEDTVIPYNFSKIATSTFSLNDSDPTPVRMFLLVNEYNITFSPPDANGVRNLTISKESYYCEPAYDPEGNYTSQSVMVSDGYGKIYTNDGVGDVDIKSMTNDTGTFFWKNGAWHPAGEEWIGDGIADPAGSSWLCLPLNVSVYGGRGTGGPLGPTYHSDLWLTTGLSENTVVEPASRLDGFYISEKGIPFTDVGGNVTYVATRAILNVPWIVPLDVQYKEVNRPNVTIHEGDLIIDGNQTFIIENSTYIHTNRQHIGSRLWQTLA